eukprot:g4770.t1
MATATVPGGAAPITTSGLAQVRAQSAQEDAVAKALSEIGPVVSELRDTFESGLTLDVEFRKAQLRALRQGILDHKEAIYAAMHADLRRPKTEILTGEIVSSVGDIDHALKGIDAWAEPESVSHPLMHAPGKSIRVPQPKGVALVIGAWNFPFQLVFAPLVGAICAGCACVVKPSEVSPASAKVVEKIMHEYLDTRAYRAVQGAVAETSALLECRWDHIFYTGNAFVARIVMKAAAKHLTPVTLELGGKSPVIVDKEVNLDVAARRIVNGKFMNNGQICVAPDYVLVHKDVEAELLAKMKANVEKFFGRDAQQSDSIARIVNERHFDRVSKLLQSHGGQIVTGGLEQADRSDNYVPPTIIHEPSPDSAIMTEEIFGPVLPVLSVQSTDEAVDFVNGREPPLAMYVYSSNTANTDDILSRTSSGGALVNDCIMHLTNPELPFGGVGASGMGAYHGKASFDTFTHHRSIMYKGTWPDLPRYPPYDDSKLATLEKLTIGPFLSATVKRALYGLAALGVVGIVYRARM